MTQAPAAIFKIPTDSPTTAAAAGREALLTAEEGLRHSPEPRSGGRDRPCGDPGRRGGHRAGVRDHGVPGPVRRRPVAGGLAGDRSVNL
jgi:hypothetical protein